MPGGTVARWNKSSTRDEIATELHQTCTPSSVSELSFQQRVAASGENFVPSLCLRWKMMQFCIIMQREETKGRRTYERW